MSCGDCFGQPLAECWNSKLFSAPCLVRDPLMQLWGAALNGRTSTKDRMCRDRCRMFPCAIHTIHSRSRSIPCWPFLSRETQAHRLNSSLQRLRIARAWGVFYDSNSAQAHSSICISACTAVLLLRNNRTRRWRLSVPMYSPARFAFRR